MRIAVFALVPILILTGFSAADTHIELRVHSESYYYGGIVHPEEEATVELWIGETQVSQSSGNLQIIVDENSDKIIVINHHDSTYVESQLPMAWSKLVAEELELRLQSFQVRGTVVETEERKKIGTRSCRCYETEDWIMVEGTTYSEREAKMWVTTDVPFDYQRFNEVYAVFLQLANYHDDLVKELEKIEGYPVLIEREIYVKGFARNESTEAVRILEESPPQGAYTVPIGYTRKTELSVEDLREM